jgi:2-amino-4-hydroxy-6-hydroxymethyldihydropteridine diphosphokinase
LTKTVQVSLSLGSNIDRYRYINAGLAALESEFGTVTCSPVYESAAVGFNGSPFLNLVSIVETSKSLTEVIKSLKDIEDENGRDRTGPKFSARTLDIDVVTYGDCSGVMEGIELPRAELFKNAFVLLPMIDLWPTQQVPGTTYTYQQLWQRFENKDQALSVVPFERR